MSKRTTKTLVPKLRFSEFVETQAWSETSLGNFIEEFRSKSTIQDEFEVLTSARNGLIRQKDYYDNNERIADRDNIGFNIIPPNYLTYRSRSDDRRFFFNENNLGITGIISSYYPVFRLLNASNKFFVELLSFHSNTVGKYSVGTSQTVLSLNELKRIKLLLPKSEEQKKIAACLSSIDELITAQAQKLDVIKLHKKGLMQQLFPAEGETVPKLRFPEFWDMGEWAISKLGANEISTFIKDRISLAQLTLESYISTENLLPDYAGATTASKLPPAGTFTHFKKHDILISNIRPYLKKIWLAGKDGGASNDVIVIRSKAKLKDQFLAYLLKSDEFISYIMKGAKGVKMPRGDISLIRAYPILFPSPDEQQKIADCLSSIDELITSQIQKLDTLKAHKKGLMQQLFTAIKETNE